jgi:hypothetical protein
MTAEGAAAMRNYCTSKDLPLLRLGKVLPTTRAEDDQQLEVLASRAGLNGLDARILSQFKLAIEEVATIPRMSRRVDH